MMCSTCCSPSSSQEKRPSSPSENISFHHAEKSKPGRRLWLHKSLVADDAILQFCSVRSSAFAKAAVGLFKWIAETSNQTWDRFWVFCMLPNVPWPACFSPTCDRSVQFCILAVHGLKCQLICSSRTTTSGKSVVNLGFTAGLDSTFLSKSSTFTASWLSTMMNFQCPVHHSGPNSFLQAVNDHLDWFAKNLSA